MVPFVGEVKFSNDKPLSTDTLELADEIVFEIRESDEALELTDNLLSESSLLGKMCNKDSLYSHFGGLFPEAANFWNLYKHAISISTHMQNAHKIIRMWKPINLKIETTSYLTETFLDFLAVYRRLCRVKP